MFICPWEVSLPIPFRLRPVLIRETKRWAKGEGPFRGRNLGAGDRNKQPHLKIWMGFAAGKVIVFA